MQVPYKKISLLFIGCCIILAAAAQSGGYVAIKTGLNIRDKPSTNAKVIGKIPYGEKLTALPLATNDTFINIVTEGMAGIWIETNYKGQKGFVINTYLLPLPPPKPGVTTLEAYLMQVTTKFGKTLTVKKGDWNTNPEGFNELKKQLYTNGAEWHKFSGYEYGGDTYFLPEFSMQQGYILLRLLGQFSEVIAPTDPLPAANAKKKLKYDDCTIKVEQEEWGSPIKYLKKLTYEWQEGANNTLELYLMDGQLVISDSSGV